MESGPPNGEENSMEEDEELADEGKEDAQPVPEVTCEVRVDGRTNFLLSKEFKKKAWRPWHQAIYVKLLGKRLSLAFMEKSLENMWAREGQLMITDVENGFYLVRFSEKKDLDHALTAGPWVILDHYLVIRAWEPDFQPFQAAVNRVMAWVRLPQFPIEYVNTKLVKSIGNWIGRFVKLDAATTSLARGRFARICVELDLSNPLQADYKIEGRLKKIEYEGLHIVCYSCGQYGHRAEKCSKSTVGPGGDGKEEEMRNADLGNDEGREVSQNQTVEGGSFGPWMLVNIQQGASKASNSKIAEHKVKDSSIHNGSRVKGANFNVLRTVAEENENLGNMESVKETQVYSEERQMVRNTKREKMNLKEKAIDAHRLVTNNCRLV
ncbi:uncharacterized protein LOC133311308 [Gastrolobium bilobum]|uniref:uncharacterized protein LOC133311308 n=1 Tax=Gastrolobium bilobum TaxID=150636 RepID=UPI002AB161B4|nr:uncharacterized protein LOC133311308 [Gastrolobium bilobum]